MNYDVKFVTEAKPIQAQLTFRAHSVLVDNYTASYIWLSDAGRFVSPFTQGFVAPLNGTQTADVRWVTPPGVIAPTVGTGQAQVTFTEGVVPPSSGTQVIVPSQQILCTIVSLSGAATGSVGGTSATIVGGSGGTNTVRWNVPAGTNSLIMAGTGTVLGGNTVVGVQSGTVYYPSSSANQTLPAAFIFSSADDTQVDVNIGTNGGGTIVYQLSASTATQAVAVQNGPAVLSVAIPGVTSGIFLLTQSSGVGGRTLSLAIPAANASAVVTLTGGVNQRWHVLSTLCSFATATSQAANLIVNGAALGNVAVRDFVTGFGGGAQDTYPDGGMVFGANETVTLTLSAGGAGVLGRLSVVSSLRAF